MSIGIWWKTWGELVRKLVILFGSFALMGAILVAFLPSPKDLSAWVVVVLVLGAILFVILVGLEFLERGSRRVYANHDVKGILRYMHRWVEHGGRVAIWNRDMTWAQNPETRALLIEKAKNKELILCLPELEGFAGELAEVGAEVCAYGAEHLESPGSRFTIRFFGRDGSRVAVGRAEGDTHVIEEFSAGHHPAFHLAEDLITLGRSLHGKRNR